MPALRVKRGTRSQVETAKGASGLAAGEPYWITDEGVFAVGTAADAYTDIGPLPPGAVSAAKQFFMAGW